MNPTLHYCHRSNEVARLQLMLRELDFTLEPDGIFGPMTQECVKTFQALHGLPATGEVNPATWDALEQHISELNIAKGDSCWTKQESPHRNSGK